MSKFFAFVFVFFLFVGVGSVCVGQLVSDTSIIFMSGKDWSLKVDSALASSIDSRNTPYMTAKSITEKELFLELATLEDCKSGVVQFKVDMAGLIAYKQLPLNLELDAKEYTFVNVTHALNGTDVLVYRPENIVNSFALFDDSGRKQAHISASKLIDASGATIWCDSNLEGGLLTVILPLEWLEGAKFPVVLDPTFGYTSIGGSWVGQGDRSFACKFNSTEAGNVTTISAYVRTQYGDGSANHMVAIYDGTPTNRLAVSSAQEVTTAAWYNFSMSYVISATDYYLAWSNQADSTDGSIAYDSGTTSQTTQYNGYPLPTVWSELSVHDYKLSIYATYTTEAEPTPTPTPSPSPNPTPGGVTVSPFPSPSVTVLSVADWGLVLEIVMLVACFVSFVWLGKVPMVPLLVGLFAFLVSLYFALSGFWSGYVVIGFFSVFVALVGGLEMLLVGLGVRVRR